eukprot:SAG11_NODE_36174_length_263_cov_0.615854_1_plen_33_part_01
MSGRDTNVDPFRGVGLPMTHLQSYCVRAYFYSV